MRINMKVKLIEVLIDEGISHNVYEALMKTFEEKINNFINDKNVFDIHYQKTDRTFSALIEYESNKKKEIEADWK